MSKPVQRLVFAVIVVVSSCGPRIARAQDNYPDSVVSYTPGTGVNANFENSSVALNAPVTGSDATTAYSIVYPAYQDTQIVAIGVGGALTVEFNTPITSDTTNHAYGMDFTIFGNEFFENGTSGYKGVFDHPGLTVWVSQDNINYYELSVPNNYGADDDFPTNPVSQGGNPFLPVNPSLTLSSFNGLSESQALSLYNGSGGGASFSISWAVNSNDQPADLSSISYIKIEGPSTSGYGLVNAIARVETVPEPVGMAALALGAAVTCGFEWRRRRRAALARKAIAAKWG